MAIKLEFDSYHNPESPTLILAKRDGSLLGKINYENLMFRRCFNTINELSLSAHMADNEELWEQIADFKLLWARDWDLWLEIYVSVDETNHLQKQITARSLAESELSQINLEPLDVNTDGEFNTVIYDSTNSDVSLLDMILAKAPNYNIKSVSNSLKDIARIFSFDGESIYDALQTIAQEINGYFDFTIHSDANGKPKREIALYDLEVYCPTCGNRGDFSGTCPKCGETDIIPGYGVDSHIYINTENLADEITYETNVDAVKNCFKLVGGDDLMTAAILTMNPNGSQYLWYIPDETRADMSAALSAKLAAYDALVENYTKTRTFNIGTVNMGNLGAYNNLITKYQTSNPDLETITNSAPNYDELIADYFATFDLEDYLTYEMVDPDDFSTAPMERLSQSRMGNIYVLDLNSATTTLINNAAVLVAQSIVGADVEVSLISSNVATGNTTTWSGSFSLRYDGQSRAVSFSGVPVVGSFDGYAKQMANHKAVMQAKSSTDIESLLGLTDAALTAKLKKYNLTALNEFVAACSASIDALIEQGAGSDTLDDVDPNIYLDYTKYRGKLSIMVAETNLRDDEIKSIAPFRSNVKNQMIHIKNALDFDSYLGDTLIKELSNYRREDTYTNSNYIAEGLKNKDIYRRAKEFIETARKDIYKSAKLQHSLSASLQNLLVIPDFDGFTDYFEVGNWIHIVHNGQSYALRLLDYTIDFDNIGNLSVTFSDVEDSGESYSDLQSVLDSARKMGTSFESVSRQAEAGNESRARLDGWQADGLSLTNMKILNNADNQDIVIDESGILLRKYLPLQDDYSDEQLKIINGTIAITDDNWETVKTAIGSMYYLDPRTDTVKHGYGINGEVIIGKLLLGESLGIYNSGATLRFDKDGLYISNDVVTLTANPNDLNSLFKITKGNNSLLNVSASGDLTVSGRIEASSGYIGGSSGWTIKDGAIYNGKQTISSTSSGIYIGTDGISAGFGTGSILVNSSGVTVNGTVQADTGYIGGSGGWTIKTGAIYSGTKSSLNSTNSGIYIGTDGISIGNGDFIADSSGNLTLSGYVDAQGLSDGDFSIGGDGLKGTTVTNSSNQTTFGIDSSGNLTIRGNIIMQGGSISWSNVSLPSDVVVDGDLADVAFSGSYTDLTNKPREVPSYIQSTYIDSVEIRSPTIKANEFVVYPTSQVTSGGLTIKGYFGTSVSDMFKIYYYNSGSAPLVHLQTNGYLYIDSPLYLDSAVYGKTSGTTYVYGNLDFSNATVTGLSSTATFG